MYNFKIIIFLLYLTSCSADPYDDFIKKFTG